MRPLINRIVLVALALGLFTPGCQQLADAPTTHEIDEESASIFNYLTNELGFSPNTIKETSSAFIVEGDIAFPKENFWENYSIQFSANSVLDENNQRGGQSNKHVKKAYRVFSTSTVKIYFASGVSSSWKTAFRSAIQKWNSLNGGIHFSEATSLSGLSTIVISGSNINGSYMNGPVSSSDVAIAFPPTSNGYPGQSIVINSGYCCSLSSLQKLYAAVHELGHSIGFGHTDDLSSGTALTTSSSSCNSYGADNSVMLGNTGGASWSGFSTCDQLAFHTLYP
jgi:Dual-action HEIGH metallo-peptidase